MIGFFPTPYPEELLYSTCARYAKRVRYPNKMDTANDLFGKRGISAVIDFPSHLDKFISNLPPNHGFSSEQIISNNTLFPFFSPFLPVNRSEIIISEMKSEDGTKVFSRMGFRVKQITQNSYLRYCPVCVVEDRKNYGEAYWHRLPQLSGINVCPDHLCFFENTHIRLGKETSAFFRSAEDNIGNSIPKYIVPECIEHQMLIKIANDAKWLLSQRNLLPYIHNIRDRYFNALLKRGLACYNGNIKKMKFVEACEKFFPSNFLEVSRNYISSTNFLAELLKIHRVGTVFHPIRHLLLITFLEMTAEDFFTDFKEFKPFMSGPYPCLNAASEHFGELLIKECEILDNLTTGEKYRGPVGVFKCSCGFIYQRFGLDKNSEDLLRFSSVREYGNIWENKLSEYWQDSNISIAEISRKLKTNPCKIVRHAIRLNLPESFPAAREIKGYKRYRKPRKSFTQSRADYREKWISVINENPKMKRYQLMNTAKFHYLWLKRFDNDWLEKNLPPIVSFERKKDLLDWKKIDVDYCEKLKAAISDILKEIPLVRISKSQISKRIGLGFWNHTRIRKVPLTVKLINENLESLENFMMRKIRFTKKLYFEEEKAPTHNQFKLRAVLKNSTSYKSDIIQKEISESVAFLRSKFQ